METITIITLAVCNIIQVIILIRTLRNNGKSERALLNSLFNEEARSSNLDKIILDLGRRERVLVKKKDLLVKYLKEHRLFDKFTADDRYQKMMDWIDEEEERVAKLIRAIK